jgi:hypothetical protein
LIGIILVPNFVVLNISISLFDLFNLNLSDSVEEKFLVKTKVKMQAFF